MKYLLIFLHYVIMVVGTLLFIVVYTTVVYILYTAWHFEQPTLDQVWKPYDKLVKFLASTFY